MAWVAAMQSGTANKDHAIRAVSEEFQGVIWPSGDLLSAPLALAQLATGSACRLAMPIPGDTGDLPPEALAAGEALVASVADTACVVVPPGPGERWWRCFVQPIPANPAPMQLSFARQQLSVAIREAAEALEQLGLQRDDPRLDAQLAEVNSRLNAQVLPRHISAVAVSVIAQATTVLALSSLGVSSDGASVTTIEARNRLAPLLEVSRAARAALVSAYSDPGTVER